MLPVYKDWTEHRLRTSGHPDLFPFSVIMLSLLCIVLASLAVDFASAHGGVTSYTIDGTTYPGWQPYNSPNGQKSIGRPYSEYYICFVPTFSLTGGNF